MLMVNNTDLTSLLGSTQPVNSPGTPHHQSWTSEPQHLRDEVGKLDGQIADIEKLLKGLSTRAPVRLPESGQSVMHN